MIQTTVRVLDCELRDWESVPSPHRRVVRSAESLPAAHGARKPRDVCRTVRPVTAGIVSLLDSVDWLRDAAKRVAEFSKGMRGRLTLARALLHQPEVLFLDEPTAGLDPVIARRVRRVIRETRDDGVTVFLTTHDMATADELCDRVAFLVDGRVTAVDTPRELRLAHGRRMVRVEWWRGIRSNAEFSMAGLADNAAFLEALRRNPSRPFIRRRRRSRTSSWR